jgi:hypothetical protein
MSEATASCRLCSPRAPGAHAMMHAIRAAIAAAKFAELFFMAFTEPVLRGEKHMEIARIRSLNPRRSHVF